MQELTYYHVFPICMSRQTATTVPEFPSKLDWLNTAPLQFRRVSSDLKGASHASY